MQICTQLHLTVEGLKGYISKPRKYEGGEHCIVHICMNVIVPLPSYNKVKFIFPFFSPFFLFSCFRFSSFLSLFFFLSKATSSHSETMV